jgi:hypothetical protein
MDVCAYIHPNYCVYFAAKHDSNADQAGRVNPHYAAMAHRRHPRVYRFLAATRRE